MSRTYSTYEAKAKFSEILRQVRSGQRVRISYRGEEVAEIRPIGSSADTIRRRIEELQEAGVLGRTASGKVRLEPVARRRGALRRFLESRE